MYIYKHIDFVEEVINNFIKYIENFYREIIVEK
jgi:hypothetical protein